MGRVLEVRELTVDLPTQAGWVKPVNDVSLSLLVAHIAATDATLLCPKCAPLHVLIAPGVF